MGEEEGEARDQSLTFQSGCPLHTPERNNLDMSCWIFTFGFLFSKEKLYKQSHLSNNTENLSKEGSSNV